MERLVLVAAAAASAGLTIWADSKGRVTLVYVFKPLATALIIVLALIGRHTAGPYYETFILAGLACSLGGDILMMLRKKRFLGGLTAFLAAHAFYIAAFASRLHGPLSIGLVVPFAVYLGFMVGVLGKHLGRMRIPVFIYMAVIMAMATLAAQRYFQTAEAGALAAFGGSILFVASDTFLAANRFVRPFRGAQVFILSTYFAAQLLIALSA
jgi:uncharacterized membrane protein YhhN